MPVKWKSLQNLKLNQPGIIDEIKSYLKTGDVPKRIEGNYMKTWRWKRLYDIFTYNPEDDHVYLVIENEEDLKGYNKEFGLLYDVDLPKNLRLVESEDEKQKIMNSYYPNVIANGFRSSKTFYDKLSEHFIGISRNDVANFVKNQEVKQMTLPTTIRVLQPIVVEKPMIHHEMDLIDMSAFSKMNNGITFVLNVIDVHSKWLWSRPLKNKSAESVAYELQNIYLNEGGPKILSSDRGPEFVNEKMRELCSRFNIEQRLATEYHPEANGQIERLNKTLKESIYSYLAQYNTKNYVSQLQFLVYNYNTSKHSTTKYTPFQLHRHRDVQFKMLHQMAFENIKKTGDKMIQQSLKKQELDEYPIEVGDHVRLSSLASKDVRRKGVLNKRRAIRNWSQTVYEVIETREDNGIEKYKIDIHDYEDRWFFRHELQYVDMEKLEKTKTYKEKQDLNFKQVYDPEKHIKELSSRSEIQEKLNEPQSILEKETEKDEEKEEQLRRGNRKRNKVMNEFFVNDY